MRRGRIAGAVLMVAIGAAGCASSGGRLETVTLRLGNRMYPEFADTVEVRPGQVFLIGDTQFSGRVDRFVPDFELVGKKVVSRSEEPNNPAVHVQVLEKDKVVEESWAFGAKGPPHMAADKFMFFVIESLKLKPGAGSARPDTAREGRSDVPPNH